MLRGGGLQAAKGAVLGLLQSAYLARSRVALLQCAGTQPHWQLLLARAPKHAAQWLSQLSAGGGTPLRAALEVACQAIAHAQQRHSTQPQRLIVLSDGRTREALQGLQPRCATLWIDSELAPVALGRGRELAQQISAQYVHVLDLPMAVTSSQSE